MKRVLFEGYVKFYQLLGYGYSEQYVSEEINAITNVDPSPTGEWVVEFNEHNTQYWVLILGEKLQFDFEEANKILCQLVQDDAIFVVDERGPVEYREWNKGLRYLEQKFDEIAIAHNAATGTNKAIDKEGNIVYQYTLKFQSLTSYRIRNTVTGELVMGDMLLCQKHN